MLYYHYNFLSACFINLFADELFRSSEIKQREVRPYNNGSCNGHRPLQVGASGRGAARPEILVGRCTCQRDGIGEWYASSAIRSLRSGLKFQFTAHVVQLAREGQINKAVQALNRFLPKLQLGNIVEVLRLLYVDENDLASAIGFVESLEMKHQQEAYEVLYQEVFHKGHNEMPGSAAAEKHDEMETAWRKWRAAKQLDVDCLKIIDRYIHIVKAKDYTPSNNIFVHAVGSSTILIEHGVLIFEKVHAAGTLEETLLRSLNSFKSCLTILTNTSSFNCCLSCLSPRNFSSLSKGCTCGHMQSMSQMR